MRMPPAVIRVTHTFQAVTHVERGLEIRERHSFPCNLFCHVNDKD